MTSTLKAGQALFAANEVESVKRLDRYSVLVTKKDQEESVCFFTTPIYNETGLVERRFVKQKNSFITTHVSVIGQFSTRDGDNKMPIRYIRN